MSANKATTPDPIDVHVGSRMRLRRSLITMSQEAVADRLGISFQQVQKYERGANRISASRLFAISGILGVPVSFFFEQAPGAENLDTNAARNEFRSTRDLTEFLSTSEGIRLNKAFNAISDKAVRRRLLELMSMIAVCK